MGDLRRSLGAYQNASAITGVLQLAIDTLDLEVATLLRLQLEADLANTLD